MVSRHSEHTVYLGHILVCVFCARLSEQADDMSSIAHVQGAAKTTGVVHMIL